MLLSPLSPGVCSKSHPLNWWCYLTSSSSAALFSICLQSFPESGSFLMSQLFTSGGQSIWASASASVLPMNIQGWFPSGLTGLISLLSKVLKNLLQDHILKASVLCITWPKYWSFSFSISPSHEYSGLISFRMDWLDLLAVQGTLESTKTSILQGSAFFIVQLSHPYMSTEKKTITLTRQTFNVSAF